MKKEIICGVGAIMILVFISVNLFYNRNHKGDTNQSTTIKKELLATNLNTSLIRLLRKRSLGSSYRYQTNLEQACSGLTPGACNDVDISRSSLCPWSIKENYDRFRKPQRIHEAKCLCYSPLIGMENTYECREIIHEMYVEKARYCEGNRCHYLATTESISVGCVPVVPCTIQV